MNPVRTFNLVFDIDNVLADTEVSEVNEIKFYQQKGFVLSAIKTHYIFPGVIELMQLLFRMPDVRVSFFSSGHQSRNELFVEKLLERALGKEHHLKIKDDVQILSGKKDIGNTDLSINTKEESQIQLNKYGLYDGNNKKSLEKVVEHKGNLENCVLIDDDSSWIKCGQEGNYLYVPALYTRDFVKMARESEDEDYMHDEYGQMKIPFNDCTSFRNPEYLKNCIINAEYISLLFENEKCTLGYVDLDQKQCEEIEISQESDEAIFKAVKKYYQKNKSSLEKKNDQTVTMTKEELDLVLYVLIEKKNGKTSSMNLNCNRICYIAGVLFKALESARSGSSLTRFLFPMHFSPKENSANFEPRFESDEAFDKREEYYYYGLEKLKQANPNFSFINPQIYKECCNMKIDNEEADVIHTLHENEEKCCLM